MAMTDLRAELDAILGAVYPGNAPVEAAMRQGRRLRLRRRAVALASIAAVVVAVAAGYPALSQKSALSPKPATPAPSAPRYPDITVTPGPGSPSGVIALGTIAGTPWKLSISDSFAGGCVSGTIGTDVVSGNCYQSGMLFPASGDPVVLQGASDRDYTVAAGGVEADVLYVVLTLTDGQRLKLIPVMYGGHRYIAYAAPAAMRVTMATAYLRNGQDMATIPFNPPGFAIPDFVTWLGPGLHESQSATAVVGSGRADGRPWSVTASIGPWGTCLLGNATGTPQGASGAACWPSTQVKGIQTYAILNDGQGPPLVVGLAASTVTEVKVTLTDGTSVRVPVRAAGGERFWALALGHGQAVRGWTAYDAAGKQVASGSAAR
jgi:hypothetical protein